MMSQCQPNKKQDCVYVILFVMLLILIALRIVESRIEIKKTSRAYEKCMETNVKYIHNMRDFEYYSSMCINGGKP